MFYDIHCHLTSDCFASTIIELNNKLKKNKIVAFSNGINYEDNLKNLELNNKFSNIKPCLGMFPLESFDKRVLNQFKNKRIVGVGEVGLDFSSNIDESQVSNLKKIARVCEELNLPMIVHSRSAEKRVVELIKNFKTNVILHYFCGKKGLIKQALEQDNVFFSISASSVYDEHVKGLIKEVPISKLLCETDSPCLWKYCINTPLNVVRAYETISEIKNLELKNVEKLIEKNVKKVFRL